MAGPRRTGVPSLIKYAKLVCYFIATYGGLIKSLTPGNTDLHDAIDAANTCCAALVAELELVRSYGD